MKNLFFYILFFSTTIVYAQDTLTKHLWEYFRHKEFDKVILQTESLLKGDSLNIDFNLLVGCSYTHIGDIKKSINYLEIVKNNSPEKSWQKSWALNYLGNNYFILQEYDKSKNAFEECVSLKPSKDIVNEAKHSLSILGLDSYYKDWITIETDHFIFHFQAGFSGDIDDFVMKREKAFAQINTFFETVLPKKIDFFVWHSTKNAQKKLKIGLGFSIPSLFIIHSHYSQTIGHELSHVLANNSIKIEQPTRFIDEGIAVCFDQSSTNRKQIISEQCKKSEITISIKDIWLNWDKYPEELSYPVSGYFVDKLIQRFGKDKFIMFFKIQTYENAKLIFGDEIDALIKGIEIEFK